ncbi:MAG: DEAD/DEAH box helicase, partial [Trueperella pyogenes]|nr:DEAD/DEAH box helicase [Trueperella pyogenes]
MEAAEPQESSWSPAEGMAQFRQQQKIDRSFRSRYVEGLSFTPDHFQIQAMDALEAGHSVLDAAPTGAGKTVVGEFAVALSLSTGSRAFYTTPIKALSNQKFTDFQKRYGEERVGLLTGDTSINPDAPIIVMTTEVLRNMIYMGADLSNLSHVVLDEVHYLADRFRGPVWEEVLIHLPQHTKVIALSATVSNAEEFGEW